MVRVGLIQIVSSGVALALPSVWAPASLVKNRVWLIRGKQY